MTRGVDSAPQSVLHYIRSPETLMKTKTNFTIELNLEEMTILRDLVRIGMKSQYYKNYTEEEIDDYECEDIRTRNMLAVQQFVNLRPVTKTEAIFDKKLFEGVTV